VVALVLTSVLVMAQSDRPRLRPLNAAAQNAVSGPEVGSRIPAFEALDTNGMRQTLDTLKGPKGLVLVFTRSADWCPYCKTQLADLNNQLAGFRKRGLNVASVSYDSAEILKTFAGRVGIKYPMLSDPESQVIRAFGLLNTNIDAKSPQYGIPFPGTYIVDAKGVITAKYFDDDYRERISAASILTREFAADGTLKNVTDNSQLKLTTSASDAEVAPGGRITLVLEIEPKAKMHLYAQGAEHYTPIAWKIEESKAFMAFPLAYPAAKMMNLPVIKENVPVYDRKIRLVRDIAVGLDPETAGTLSTDRTLTVKGSFQYQACDDRECYLPKTLPLEWTLKVGKLDTQRAPESMQRK
jgi:peroxiredoxin